MTRRVVPAEGIDGRCAGYDLRPLARGDKSFRPCMAPPQCAVIEEDGPAVRMVALACAPHARQIVQAEP